ncbi:M23 family metallopeptidase [Paenarthrobacter nitroguajacolicus]|uniref:M23 family metallopeptidase n=1 Tax=Paenarthrobacter nitroguajacolicus TaxID=211146 RepID=UPI003AE229B5
MHSSRGRRRATVPASPPQSAGAYLEERPRAGRGHRRRRRGAFRQITDFAAASGVGQKAAIALAASGLVLTLSVPVTGPTMAAQEQGQPLSAIAAAAQPEISAAAGARIEFSRSAVGTRADPDGKLKQLLGTQSAGTIARAASAGTLGAPLAAMTMVSPFGYRVSPLTGGSGDFHRGQDLVAQCGTSVRGAAAGTVTFASWDPYGGGNRVVVDHGNGLKTTYNHLSSFNVLKGQKLSRGDVVALSGTTGASTGCHLHFEVEVNGQVVDPSGWL